jgi:hypothetical protein
MAATRDRRPSEYGGTPGRIQGVVEERDEARLMRATDSLNPQDDTVSALAREMELEGRTALVVVTPNG